MTDRLCYKLLTAKDGKYSSFTHGAVSVKYAIGKKTRPLVGPLFAYYHESLPSLEALLRILNEMHEINRKDIAIFEAEYSPYNGRINSVISPLAMAVLNKDHYEEFWTSGLIKELDRNDYIEARFNNPFAVFCFCEWIKPISEVTVEELSSRISKMQRLAKKEAKHD